MYGRYSAARNLNNVNQYLVKEILDATPEKLLFKVYDFAIAQVQRHNLEKANKAIQELINALNFESNETKEISIGLLKLYKFCQDQMRLKEYDLVHRILSELKESWVNAFNKLKNRE